MIKHFEDTHTFKLDKKGGMQIAFGVTQFEYLEEETEDPTYGELKLVYKKWGDGA